MITALVSVFPDNARTTVLDEQNSGMTLELMPKLKFVAH